MTSSSQSSPRRWILLVVVASVTAAGLGLVAGLALTSPGELAATASPPEPTSLYEPVRTGLVRDVLRTNCSIRSPFVEVGLHSNVDGSSLPIISAVNRHALSGIGSGEMFVEIAGRPVIALQGRVPAYRTLAVGSEGDDVRQLQRALELSGVRVGDVPGKFGHDTARGIMTLYQRAGYPANLLGSPEQLRVGPSDLLFLPVLPARVVAGMPQIGQSVDALLVSFATGGGSVHCRLPAASARVLSPGDGASIQLDSGRQVQVRIVGIGRVHRDAAGASMASLVLRPVPGVSMAPGNGLGVFVLAESSDQALYVPLTALREDAAGGSFVLVSDPAGGQRDVGVRTGVVGSGFVEVVPTDAGQLAAGDLVRVGT